MFKQRKSETSGVTKAILVTALMVAACRGWQVIAVIFNTTLMGHWFWYSTIGGCHYMLHQKLPPRESDICLVIVAAYLALAILDLSQRFLRRKA